MDCEYALFHAINKLEGSRRFRNYAPYEVRNMPGYCQVSNNFNVFVDWAKLFVFGVGVVCCNTDLMQVGGAVDGLVRPRHVAA